MAVTELETCAMQGLKGAMIWGAPPKDKPYSSTVYDPFWQAASECAMPLSLHVITGKGKGTDLSELPGKIEGYLQGEGFTVKTSAPSDFSLTTLESIVGCVTS